jgi:hypothetical protein
MPGGFYELLLREFASQLVNGGMDAALMQQLAKR